MPENYQSGLDNLVLHGLAAGALDFDLCGLGYFLLEVTATLGSMRSLRAERLDLVRESFFEGYERERILPAEHLRYLGTFDVTGRVAAVDRQISLLSAGREGTRGVLVPAQLCDVDPEKPPASRREAASC